MILECGHCWRRDHLEVVLTFVEAPPPVAVRLYCGCCEQETAVPHSQVIKVKGDG